MTFTVLVFLVYLINHSTSKPKKTKTPRGQGKPRPYRVQWQDDGVKLRELIQTRKGLRRRPKLHAALESKRYVKFEEMAQLTRSNAM